MIRRRKKIKGLLTRSASFRNREKAHLTSSEMKGNRGREKKQGWYRRTYRGLPCDFKKKKRLLALPGEDVGGALPAFPGFRKKPGEVGLRGKHRRVLRGSTHEEGLNHT